MSDQTKRTTTATPMMPRDTNPMGNIFGGEILSHIDQAGFIAAGSVCAQHVGRVVTVAMDKVIFKKPVHVGDVLECNAAVTRVGRSSIAVHVEVEAFRAGERIPVTAADVVYVAVNKRGRPVTVACSQAAGTSATSRKGRDKAGKAKLPDPSKCPVTATPMMPRDLNAMGSIFAGVILSHIDMAGAIAARAACSSCKRRVVTVAMDKIVFKKPVLVGDILQCYADVTKIGNTSISTHIEVVVNRNGKLIPVTSADAVYVAVGKDGRPVPVKGKASAPKAGCPKKHKAGKTRSRSSCACKGRSQ